MDQARATQALTSLSAALVGPDDALSRATGLLGQCRDVLGADASAILVLAGSDLELFVASSHAATQLELHQTRLAQGPCEDAVAGRTIVQADGRDELHQRWPDFAPAMLDTGFSSVRAAPLMWRDTAMGALVLYARQPGEMDAGESTVLGAFADIATAMLLQTPDLSTEDLAARIRRVLSERVMLEQAKGVMAERVGCDMEAAHLHILDHAAATGVSLTSAAATILAEAVRLQHE
ncbi:MAG: GAF and ANTAR domain-containing protein [Aeromicrobium sp.]